ncbi:MAG TPA: tetratricopeptide repeat protein, partial [Sandaracinaceae bacterium]
ANEESEESLPEDGRGDPREQRIRHLLRLANFQRNRGNLQDAESNYLAVLDLDRDNARALAGLARLHMARGSNGQALRWARRLVAARPRNAANHVLLGDVLEANGNRRAAAASWRRALELSPGLRSAQQRLARGR